MEIIQSIRNLRHGRLKKYHKVWFFFGELYRKIIRLNIFDFYSSHYIGTYGPYYMDANFAFSDFSKWGEAKSHNNGFEKCVASCANADCVFDIGAHIGLVSLPMSRAVSKAGKIYAFEPSTANVKYLKKHISKNNINNIVVVETLVGDEDKHVGFYEMSSASGMNSIAPKDSIDKYNKVSKRQICIDSFCIKNNLHPDVMKIDVEGAEIGVLKGAIETITECKPLIFLSYHPREIKNIGLSEDDLFNFIKSVRYKCVDMDGKEVKELGLLEYILMPN